MKRGLKLINLTEKPLNTIDWLIFFVLAVICFFCFQQADIMHTGGSSIAYLNGHFLDFYDYNTKYVVGNSYLPSTYILYAIWNIPVRLLGLMKVPAAFVSFPLRMWFKLLPTLFYFASAFLMYKVAFEMGMGTKKSKLCAYAFLTMPIGFFSQFIFGQYDSFTVFFVLLGLLFYFKKDMLKFTLFFGISMTFKYFPLLIFVPLLLLAEKRIWHIAKYVALLIIPVALELLVYYPSPAFRSGVIGFGATNYLFQVSLDIPQFSLSLFIVFWLFIAGAAYFVEVKGTEQWVKYAVFYSNMVVFLIFGLSFWHPQWLLFAVPFWVLGAFINKKLDIFMIIEFLLMLFYILFTVNIFVYNVDQGMLGLGIFDKLLAGRINNQMTIGSFYKIQSSSVFYSAFSGVLLVSSVFKHPRFCADSISESVDKFWGWVRFRFAAGLAVFIIPAVVCFSMALQSPYVVFSTGADRSANIGALTANLQTEQLFTANSDGISRIQILVGTYMRTNHSDLTINVVEADSGKVLKSIVTDVSTFKDNTYSTIDFETIPVQIGKQYIVQFVSSSPDENNCITIYHTAADTAAEGNYAIINEEKEPFNLCITLLGNKAP